MTHSGLGWRRRYLPGVPVISMNISCSLCPPGRAALSLRLEQLSLSRSCCALVSWSVQLGGLWLPADLGQVRLSWVIPAGPVSGWLLAGAVFWPCQLVRHVLQQGHESGAPPLTGKKKHSVLCDSPEMQVTRLHRSGLGTGASLGRALAAGDQKATEKCVNSWGSHLSQVGLHRGSSERVLVSDKLVVCSWFGFLNSRVWPGLSPVP